MVVVVIAAELVAPATVVAEDAAKPTVVVTAGPQNTDAILLREAIHTR